ncbi:MAG: hypothetical protein ABI614_07455 [Planctomycetota bacterium]
MEIPILVEPISDNGFRATSGGPLGLEIEAPSRQEAIDKLRELIDRRIAGGAEVVGVEIGGSQHPLAPFAGILRDDPLLQPWKNAMAEYRAQTGDSETP